MNSQNPAKALKDTHGLPEEIGYATALQVAIDSFDMMREFKTPPIPKAYEIFYAYASGKPDELIERVDAATSHNGVLDLHQIYGIHGDLFAYPEAMREQQEHTNDQLDAELGAVLDMVHSHMTTNEAYSSSLKTANKGLSKSSSPAALRQTIEQLLAANTKAEAESRKLTESLEASQDSIKEMREQLSKAREAGLRDALTRLYNRRHFDSILPEEITKARANDTGLCLVMVDVDHFKAVNDTFGHPAGDAVLRVVGGLLAENVKGRDTPVRYGGEEFAIILPDTGSAGAMSLANKIRRQLERKNLVLKDTNQSMGKITASFGVSQLNEDDTPQTLISRADQMLYDAKRTGRNKVVCDDRG